MTKDRKFFKCDLCGNMVGMIHSSGVKMVCCGKNMTEILPNTVEASTEKHIPVGEIKDNVLKVTIGSVIHPMTEEHHIEWIMTVQGPRVQRVELEKTGAPSASFCVCGSEDVDVYAYCNLHGLWKATIKKPYEHDDATCSAEFSNGCIL